MISLGGKVIFVDYIYIFKWFRTVALDFNWYISCQYIALGFGMERSFGIDIIIAFSSVSQ